VIKEREGQFKLIQGPTRVGSKNDGIEAEEIMANMQKIEDDESKSSDEEEEDQTEGMDLDLDEEIAAEDDDNW